MRLLVPDQVTDVTLISSSVAEDDAPLWDSGATYSAGDLVMMLDTHTVYESLRASNTNRDPRRFSDWWTSRGPTNRWAMFDGDGSTATTDDGIVVVDITTAAVSEVAFIDLIADSVSITYGGTVITKDVPAPTAPATSVNFTVSNVGHSGGTLRVAVSGSGTVSIGNIAVGGPLNIGTTLHGATVGIIDYSRKTTDEFGNVSVVRGSYSRRVTARVKVEAADVDTVVATLSAVRGTPCVWDVSPRHEALDVFGYYTDWSLDVAHHSHSIYSITLESMYQAGLSVAPGASISAPPEPTENVLFLDTFSDNLAITDHAPDIAPDGWTWASVPFYSLPVLTGTTAVAGSTATNWGATIYHPSNPSKTVIKHPFVLSAKVYLAAADQTGATFLVSIGVRDTSAQSLWGKVRGLMFWGTGPSGGSLRWFDALSGYGNFNFSLPTDSEHEVSIRVDGPSISVYVDGGLSMSQTLGYDWNVPWNAVGLTFSNLGGGAFNSYVSEIKLVEEDGAVDPDPLPEATYGLVGALPYSAPVPAIGSQILNDIAWFKGTFSAGQDIRVRTDLETIIVVLDADFYYVGEGWNAEVVFNPGSGGVFYIAICAYNNMTYTTGQNFPVAMYASVPLSAGTTMYVDHPPV